MEPEIRGDHGQPHQDGQDDGHDRCTRATLTATIGARASHDQWWVHDTGLTSTSVRARTMTASAVRPAAHQPPGEDDGDGTSVATDSTSHTRGAEVAPVERGPVDHAVPRLVAHDPERAGPLGIVELVEPVPDRVAGQDRPGDGGRAGDAWPYRARASASPGRGRSREGR